MKSLSLALFFFIDLGIISAQNLVPNGSFEIFTKCPGDYSQAPGEFRIQDWFSANAGTPDHFNACSNGEADVPHNWAGVSDPYEGAGYVGIYVWMDNMRSYREYLECKLTQPLIRDSVYEVEFHFKLSSYAHFSIDRIGLLLTDSAVSTKSDRVIKRDPTLSVILDSAFTRETGTWEHAKMFYKAKGGEQFVTIGNFFDDASTKSFAIPFRPVQQQMLAQSAYYYVDAVKVTSRYFLQQQLLLQKIPDFSIPETQLNITYVLKNIQFQYDSYRLVPPSFSELDKVAEYLLKNPNLRVQLFGHTDDRGGDRYNLKLSQSRAKNVADYLATVGIRTDRIDHFGFGKSKPLVPATTEEARAINRRVEVRFVLP